jgi:Leucine-rich repeat (LRR) protein
MKPALVRPCNLYRWIGLLLFMCLSTKYCFALLPVENNVLLNLVNDFPILQSRGWSASNLTAPCNAPDPVTPETTRLVCENDKIVSLRLDQLGLTGTIPAYIGLLPFLTFLDLSRNNFNGTIPQELANSTIKNQTADWTPQLQVIYLYRNDLEGTLPATLDTLTPLIYLYINENPRLSGNVPRFNLLPNLRAFVAYQTALEGTLPEFVNPGLTTINLFGTKISGPIPPSIGNLASTLDILSLSDTNINGTIPPEITQCAQLTVLNLASTKISGAIPPDIFTLPRLLYLYLGNTLIDPTIPATVGLAPALRILHMPLLGLTGSIPDAVYNLTTLQTLDLTGNMLTGTISPLVNRLQYLFQLKLDSNQLYGPLPQLNISTLSQLLVGSNRLNGTLPSFNFTPSLTALHVDNNSFTGPLPSLAGLNLLDDVRLAGNAFSGCLPTITVQTTCVATGSGLCGCDGALCGLLWCGDPLLPPVEQPMSAAQPSMQPSSPLPPGTPMPQPSMQPSSSLPPDTPIPTSPAGLAVPKGVVLKPPSGTIAPIASAVDSSQANGIFAAIIIAVVVGLALIIAGIVLFIRRHRRLRRQAERSEEEPSSSEELQPTYADPPPKYDSMVKITVESQQRVQDAAEAAAKGLKPEWIIPFEDLIFGKRLGEGAYGIVFKGRWKATDVAFVVISCYCFSAMQI